MEKYYKPSSQFLAVRFMPALCLSVLCFSVLCFIFVLVPLESSQAQQLLEQLYGTQSQGKFGQSIAEVGDLNGDKIPDFAVGAPEVDSNTLDDNGVVTFYSGSDGTQLGSYTGLSDSERAGAAIVGIGDIDFDGVPDIAIGAPTFDGTEGTDQGKVIIISGATFTKFYRFKGPEPWRRFGSALAVTPDHDGDGFKDLIVGAPSSTAAPAPDDVGSVFLYSIDQLGATQLARFDGDADELFGSAVSSLGDVNSDGKAEIIVGGPNYDGNNGFINGRIQVFSGASPYPLLTEIEGNDDFENFGFSVAEIEDPDGSGDPHVLVGAVGMRGISGATFSGGCRIFSIPNGDLVREYTILEGSSFLGWSITTVPDQDGDSIEDVLIGAPLASPSGKFTAGIVELLSSAGDGNNLTRIQRFEGPNDADRCGESVASLGNLRKRNPVEFGWGCNSQLNPDLSVATGGAQVICMKRCQDGPFSKDKTATVVPPPP